MYRTLSRGVAATAVVLALGTAGVLAAAGPAAAGTTTCREGLTNAQAENDEAIRLDLLSDTNAAKVHNFVAASEINQAGNDCLNTLPDFDAFERLSNTASGAIVYNNKGNADEALRLENQITTEIRKLLLLL